jgi:hypothetical protein
MKYALIALFALIMAVEMSFPVGAVATPQVDDIEAMIKRVQNNISVASQVTKIAQTKSAALVAQKVDEKQELKEAVVVAEQRVDAITQVNEMFAAKMIANGMDTAIEEIKMTGPAYDAYLNYVEEGGKEEFDYFRMYLWQQK